MALQALSIPFDITWQRLSFAQDMVDDNFGDLDIPPRWRSSLAVYGYVVPEDQTAEQYPDSRIVYLKLICTITGWNPSEELQRVVDLDQVGSRIDDLQQSTWEAIQADGWAQTYWPCMGAVAQIAIYPSRADTGIGIADFPWISDFEPKRRELYESISQSDEVLSGSSESIAVQKGTTTLDHSEMTMEVSAGYGPTSASTSLRVSSDETTVNNRNTDTSREDRETKSFTSTYSQMYQLFTGYHLGTNRALFSITPRPHTVGSSDQVDFNLIRGSRALEGMQEMFLVVQMPRRLTGLCLQASLDTGHDVQVAPGIPYMAMERQPNGGPERQGPGDTGGNGNGDGQGADGEDELLQRLVVTRRVVRSCSRFDVDDRLVPVGGSGVDEVTPRVVFEGIVAVPADEATVRRRAMTWSANRPEPSRADRLALATRLNVYQRRVAQALTSGLSAGTYQPRRFVDTGTFRRLVAQTLSHSKLDLDVVKQVVVLDPESERAARSLKARTLGDLFARDPDSKEQMAALVATRRRVIDAVVRATQRGDT